LQRADLLRRLPLPLDAEDGLRQFSVVAAHGIGSLLEPLDALAELIHRFHHRQPAVAPLGDALVDALGRETAQQYWRMRALCRFRKTAHRREIHIFAVIFGFRLGPELLHGQDVILGLPPAMVEIAAENLAFLAIPARP